MAIKLRNNRVKLVNRRRGNGRTVTRTQVRAMIQGKLDHTLEEKIGSATGGPTLGSAAGVVLPITQTIIQGDNLPERGGDKIQLKHVRLSLSHSLNTALSASQIRYILFADTTNNGVAVAVTDVLTLANTQSGYASVYLLKKRFRVLYDEVHPAVQGGNNQIKSIVKNFPLDLNVYYQGGTNAIGSNGSNALFLLVITDTSTTPISYAYDIQMRFTDA